MKKLSMFLLLILLPAFGNPVDDSYDIGLAKESIEIVCDKNSGYVNGRFAFLVLGSSSPFGID